MTDMTHFASPARRKATPRIEYGVYFAAIVLATLVPATLVWALTALRGLALPERGPIARAVTQARIITPQIFNI